jgi:hypothetical protein
MIFILMKSEVKALPACLEVHVFIRIPSFLIDIKNVWLNFTKHITGSIMYKIVEFQKTTKVFYPNFIYLYVAVVVELIHLHINGLTRSMCGCYRSLTANVKM